MSVNKPKLLSGRVPVVDYGNLTADRYQFLGLGQAEPNLGPGAANSVLTLSTDNTRVWANTLSLTAISVTGNISAVGNITANYYFGNGSFLTGVLATNVNANALIGNTLSGNVLYSSLTSLGILSNLSVNGNISINAVGNILLQGLVSATGNVYGSNLTITTNISAGGNIFSGADISVVGNIRANNISTSNIISAAGNIFGGGIRSTSSPTAPVNPSVGDFWYNTDTNVQYRFTFDGTSYYWVDDYGATLGANGSFTSIINGNSNVSVFNNSNIVVGVAGVGNIVTWATTGEYVNGVISATGNIYTAGQISTVGNITVGPTGFFVGNLIGNITGNLAVPGANTDVLYNNQGNVGASTAFTFDFASNVLAITGNVISENLSVSGNTTLGNFTFENSNISTNSTTDIIIKSADNKNTLIVSGGADAYTALAWIDSGNLANANGSQNTNYIYVDADGAFLNTLDPVSQQTYQLQLDTNGNLSVPGNVSAVGNITGANLYTAGEVSATANITSNSYFVGNGAFLTGVEATNANANALVGNTLSSNVLYSSLTSVGTLSNLSVSGDINTNGNLSAVGNILSGNILTTGLLSAYSNITGGNLLTIGLISSTGNLTTANISASGNVLASGLMSVAGNLTSGNILTTGVISATSSITSSANVSAGNILTTGYVSSSGNVKGGNLLTTGLISAQGNAFFGNVSLLNLISAAGNIISNANITGGNILTTGVISATANITSNSYFIGNGYYLTGVIAVNVPANALVGNTLSSNVLYSSLTSVGVLTNLSVSGNTTSGNLLTGGLISATSNITSAANITASNLLTSGLVSATANIIGGNVITAGQVSASGNLNGGGLSVNGNAVIVGNLNVQGNVTFIGSNVITTNDLYIELANNQSTYANINNAGLAVGPNNTPLTYWQYNTGANAWTTNVAISATSNVIGGNVLTDGLISSTGNVTSGNVLTSGIISSTGNVTGGNVLTSGIISSTGNVTGGNVFTNGIISSTGNVFASNGSFTGNLLPTANITYSLGNNSLRWSNLWLSNSTIYIGNVIVGATATTLTVNGANVVTSDANGNISTIGNITSGNLLTTGLISATSNIIGGNIQTAGNISATGNINIAPGSYFVGNLYGNLTGNITVPGSNTQVIYNNNGNAGASTGFTFNQASNTVTVSGNINGANVLTSGIISSTGNVTSGNVLTAGIVSSTGNAIHGNVLTIGLISATSTITSAANITGANILTGGLVSATGNITGNYIIGNGSQLTSLTGGNVTGNVNSAVTAGTVTTNAQPNITSVGTLTSVTSSGLVSTTGNVQGANVFATANISATGNVTGNYIIGNGSQLTSLTGGNVTGQVGNALISGTVYTNAQPNITSVGTLTSITSSGLISTTGNVQGANVFATTNISATGNVTGNYIIGNGSTLTSLTGGNVTGQVANALISGTVYTNAQPNITSVGTLTSITSSGLISTTGNVQGANVFATANISATANVIGGNILTGGQVSSTGNITVSPTGFFVGNIIGNVTGNLAVPGANTQVLYNNQGNVGASAGFTFNAATNAMVVIGNVTGNYIIGNGSQLSSITGGNVTGQVGNALISGTVYTNAQPNITSVGTLTSVTSSGLISTTGNVQGANVFATANISATANVNGGNLLTGGLVSANGNVTGNYHIGNGSTLTSLTGGNVTGQVGNALVAGTVYTNAQPNITSVGTLTSLSVTGNTTSGNVLTAGLISATSTITSAANITGGNLLTVGVVSATGNAIAGNILTAGLISAAGNVIGGNLLTNGGGGSISGAGSIIAGGNITGGNIITAGQVSASGNLNGGALSVSGNAVIVGNLNVQGNVSFIGSNVITTNDLYIELANNQTTYANINNAGLAVGPQGTPLTYWQYQNASNAWTTNVSISATANVTGGNVLTGGQISSTGNITVSPTGFFVGNVIGNITGNLAVPGANTQILYNNQGNVGASAGFTFNAATNAMVVTGNTTSGNILTAGLISATGNVTGNYIIGNGSTLSSITGGNVTGQVGNALISGTVYTNAQPNITSVGILTSITSSGLISTTGNILTAGIVSSTGNAIHGNVLTAGLISATSTITSAANITGANILTGGLVSATGNVTGNYIIGNGSQLTSITGGNVTGQVGNALIAGTVYTNAQPNITSVGTLTSVTSSGLISTTGNVQGANVFATANISATGNVTSGNILTGGQISSTGNITVSPTGFFVGNIIGNVTGNLAVPGANTQILYNNQGNVGASAGFTFNAATNAMVVTGNTTSGNILTAGLISATGNVTGNYILGNGSQLSSITGGNVTGQVGNALISGTVYTNAQPNITSVGTLTSLSVTGNTTSGNLLTSGLISATSTITSAANITGGNVLTAGLISSTGNATAGNILTSGLISATSTITSAANIIGGNVITAGQVSASGNLNGGNLSVTGNAVIVGSLNVQGNVTFIGSNVITTNDLYIELANNQTTYANINNAGLAVGPAGTPLTYWQYQNASNAWTTNVAISATANVIGGNILTGGQISSTGNITVSPTGFFVGNIIGNVTGNLAVPGANTQILYNNQGNVGASAGFTFNAATNAMVVTGNTTSGNILTAGLISATGNVTGNYIIGNGSTLSSITGGNVTGQVANALIAGTVYTNAQPNITSVGTLTSVTSSGLISTTGNVQGANVFATANISATANVIGGNLLTTGVVSATGNVTGNYHIGNGSTLSSITGGNVTGQVGNALISGTVYTNAQPNITSVGTLTSVTSSGLISTTGNVQGANVFATANISATANVIGGNILTGGQISSTGNITVSPTGFFVGNIIGNVTGNLAVPGANTQILYNNQGNVGASAGFTFNAATNAMVVTGNTTSGNILTTGLISATGNVTGNYILGNGSQLSSITGGNVTGQVANALIAGTVYNNAQPNITSVGTLTSVTSSGLISTTGNVQGANVFATANISATANVIGGNLLTSGLVSATGNTVAGNLLTSGVVSATANISGGNILTGGQISSTGNITVSPTGFFVGNIIGNVTGNLAVPGANTQILYNNQGNVGASAGFTFNAATNVMTVSGNTTSGNFLTGGLISATSTITSAANIIGANILTAGLISATSTITSAANIIGGNIITAGQVSASGNLNGGALSVSGNATIVGNLNVQGNVTFIGSNVITTNDLYIQLANNQSTYANINNAGLAVGPAGTPLTYWQYQNASNAWTTNVSISATANVIGGNILTGGQISSTGNITTSPTGFFVGNIIGNVTGNLAVPGANTQILYNNQGNVGASAGFTFNAATNALGVTGTVTGSNFLTGGLVSASGNVTGSYFVGSGNGLSNIQGASVTGTVSSATTATTATTAGTVTTNAQPNITSVGTLSTLSVTGNTTTGNLLSNGQISTQGNITTASYFIGTFLGSISGNITAPGTNTQVIYNNSGNLAGSTGFTYNSATNAISGGGNIIANSNVIVGGNITSAVTLTGYGLYAGNAGGTPLATFVYNNTTLGWTSNIPLAPSANTSLNLGQTSYWWNNLYVVNINTSAIGASGNITGGNLLYGSGLVSGTGNIYANNVLATTIVNAASHTGSVVSVTGNITGNNIIGANLITTVGSISATGNITTANYFIGTFQGNISGNLTVPGANTQILYNNQGNAGASAGLTFNAGTNALVSTGTVTGSNFLTGGYVSAAGNVTGNYHVGNGSTLSSITGGNVTGTVANATYAVSAGTAGTVTTNAQPNVTSLGTLSGLSSTGLITTSNQISATGNITTASYFIGTFLGSISGNVTAPGLNTQVIFNNSGNLAGSPGFTFNQTGNALTANGNITGANILTTGLISATSTITGSTFYGSGAGLTSLTGANVTGTVANATYAVSAGTAGTVTTNAQPNITSVGNLVGLSAGGNIITTGQISAAGNITISSSSFFVGNVIGNITGNLSTPGANTQVIYNNNGNAGASAGFTFNAATNAVAITGNTTSGNFLTGGYVSAQGNVTGGNYIGSGAFLTSLPGGNVTGTVANATYAVSAGTAGTVTANAQPNITSVGTLTSIISSGNISATGSISSTGNITTGGYFIGNVVGNISGNFTVPGANTQVIYNNSGNAGASAGLTFNAGTNALATSGNITVGGTATTGATLSGYGLLGGNAGGTPVATFVYNNTTQAWTSNVAVAPAANISLNLGQTGYWWNNFYAVNVNTSAIAASGNITGGNILTGGVMSSTGNATHGNLSTGIVNATSVVGGVMTGTSLSTSGNVTAGNLTVNSPNIAIGLYAGTNQGTGAVAIGSYAGQSIQGTQTVAIGQQAAEYTQGNSAVAIGYTAGYSLQGQQAVALGFDAGYTTQGLQSVAVGTAAGYSAQGNNSIAMGAYAGFSAQGNNSIILNATGLQLNQTVANTFTVAPVRNDLSNTANVLYYNTSTKEITYSNTLSLSGNITGGNISGTGLIVTNPTVGNWTTQINNGALGNTAGNQVLMSRWNSTDGNQNFLELTEIRNQTGTAWTTAGTRLQEKIDATWMGFVQFNGNVNGGITFGTGLTTANALSVPDRIYIDSSGNMYPAANVSQTLGSSSSWWSTIYGKATQAQYADLAEMYVSDRDYSPGTVVDFDGDKEITVSTTAHSTKIAGVVSTNPAYLMNSIQVGEHVLPIALTGRVPCQVIGKINKGDRLVSSNILGVAQALDIMLYQPGVIIGKAIESYDSDKIGIIEVSVGRF